MDETASLDQLQPRAQHSDTRSDNSVVAAQDKLYDEELSGIQPSFI